MTSKTKKMPALLSFAAAVFLAIAGCGGSGSSAPASPTPADLTLTKIVDNDTPTVGGEVTFTITISNAGPFPATGVIVTDQLPSGFTYVSDNSGGAYDPTSGVWSVGTVAVASSAYLTIIATVNDSGIYTNLAEVTASNDSTPNNNSAGVAAPPPSINVSINQIQADCTVTPAASTVKAFVTVVDQDRNPITSLTSRDFSVSENQIAVPAFDVEFVRAIPLSVAIVLDYSTSLFDTNAVTNMENAAITFLNQLSADDRAEIIKFNKTVQTVQPFTNVDAAGLTILSEAIRAPFTPENVTELYEAILAGLAETAIEPADNRKAVVFFTDGRNNPDLNSPPVPSINKVLSAAKLDGIPLFPIVLGSSFRKKDIEELTLLAEESGGTFYQAIKPEDLQGEYLKLADALIVNQFVFTYTSPLIGGVPVALMIGADYGGLQGSDTRNFVACP